MKWGSMELNKMGPVPQHLFKVIRTPNRLYKQVDIPQLKKEDK